MEKRPLAIFAIRQVRRATGAARNAIEQAEYVRNMGYDIRICAERVDRVKLAALGIRWIYIPRFPVKGYMRRVFFDWCVQRYVDYVKPELFISHADACSRDILVMHNCAELAHEQVHKSAAPDDDELIRFQRRVLQHGGFRYLIANSELMKRDFIERYELDSSKVGVFYQGVDTSIFNYLDHETFRYQGRRILGLSDDAYVAGLVTSGAFLKRNVRFFLDVAAHVKNHISKVHFVIAGKDSSIESYRSYAKSLGLDGVVTFAPTVDNVQLYFHALDVFVYPAKIEEYGRVVLEALACGTPAIISAAVGASEIMTLENIPKIIKGWDVERWAEEIIVLAKQPAKAQAYINAGISLAERYSQSNRGEAMRELLANLAVN